MTILLFVLTAVLVGYVVYTFYSSNAGQTSGNLPNAHSAAEEKPAPANKPKPKEKKTAGAGSVEPAAVPSEPTVESADAGEPGPTQYRDPKTGATAAVPTNYRFAKRWIKEALVAEGLLDRVYKNNELDDKVAKKVKIALDKFREIKKYHA